MRISAFLPCLTTKTTKNTIFLFKSKLLFRGVPNFLIRQVILKLISFDNDISSNNYNQILECLDPLPDFLKASPTTEALFGRRHLENVFLTSSGTISCKRVLFALKFVMNDSKFCVILPRVTQLLLWFLKEHEVFTVLQVLLKESVERKDSFSMFFGRGLCQFSYIASVVLTFISARVKNPEGLMDDQIDSQANHEKSMVMRLVNDMTYHFLVGYISPEYYPIVLMYFINDGIGGFIRLVIALVQGNYSMIRHFIRKNAGFENFRSEFKHALRTCFDITALVKVIKN